MSADDRTLDPPDPGSAGTPSDGVPESAPDPVQAARLKFVAAIVAATRTRDTLASERDQAAAARDLAAALHELGGHASMTPEEARKFAAHDRQASRDDRAAAADDRSAAAADQAALIDGAQADNEPDTD
jgi:hypothetical protein